MEKTAKHQFKKLWPVWVALGVGLLTFLVLYFFVAKRPATPQEDSDQPSTIEGVHLAICNNEKTITIKEDKTPPNIDLNGKETLTTTVGKEVEIPAPVITDDCNTKVKVKTTGKVDFTTAGNYELKYEAKDSSGNLATATRIVKVIPENTGVIYLTFDDGPSEYTNQLLDILKKYNVKVTFFVTGSGSDDALRREYEEGHAIGLHTFVHSYQYVYQSVDVFMSDIYRIQDRVKNATGHTSYLMRFPGGSSNTVSASYDGGTHIMSKLVDEVERQGFSYFDWNVSSGDAGGAYSSDAVYENVVNNLRPNGNSVVLQHDSKQFSIEAVERIIQYGLANGYTFSKLDANSPGMHHGVNN